MSSNTCLIKESLCFCTSSCTFLSIRVHVNAKKKKRKGKITILQYSVNL